MVIKKILLKILLIIFLTPISFLEAKKNDFKPVDSIKSYCLGKISNYSFSEIKKIEIKVNKNKVWAKNLLNLHVEFESEKAKSQHENWFPNFRISDKFKKKFKSKIYIDYKDSTKCVFNSFVRVTGDLWWHLGWDKGTPISSINIELLDGNVDNITRFKLLLPASRYGSNEIFTSIFLKHLNFLSPKTFYVKGKINGFTSNYIFQEDLRKEFLENSGLKEGPILEGDERFTISLKDSEHLFEKKTNLSKIANKAYAKKSSSNSHVALESVSNLNKLYLLNHKANYPENFSKNINLYLFTDYFFRNKNIIEKLETYEALVYAIDAAHSLSFDDRRFYYDSINRSFLPIYYDGKSKILENEQITKDKDLTNASSSEAKRGAEKALKKTLEINKSNLKKELNEAGLKISLEELDKVITKIILRLKIIGTSSPPEINIANKKSYFSSFSDEETRKKKLVFAQPKTKEFLICDFKKENCISYKTDREEYDNYLADVLNQDFNALQKKFKIQNDLIFVHSDANFEKSELKINDYPINWKEIKVDNTTLMYNEFIDLKVDKNDKIVIITQTNNNGIVLFKNGSLNDWQIQFKGSLNNSNIINNKLNPFNLTGCLNIHNMDLVNVSFKINDSSCEDAINLIQTRGTINEIYVDSSVSDAVDMDFSNLQVENINIKNSLNDCLDLSYGKYIINKLTVNKCGDKGLSVGEKSKLNLDTFISKDTKMAVASKDSSTIQLNLTDIKNTEVCFAAYRKKQEFTGGRILINSSNCSKDKNFTSKGSEIVFLK